MHAHQEQGAQQYGKTMCGKANPGERHNGNFHQLDEARHTGLVELVDNLPGGCRKQEKWQNENAGGKIAEQFRLQRSPACSLEREQHHECIFEQVIVKGA